MSEKIVQLNEEVIKGQLKELVRGSVEETLNELLEAEAEKLTQAARYERNEQRQGYRSGHYNRNLTTPHINGKPHAKRKAEIDSVKKICNSFVGICSKMIDRRRAGVIDFPFKKYKPRRGKIMRARSMGLRRNGTHRNPELHRIPIAAAILL